ncbi:MAG: hypothetical protein ACP5N7_03055 [Candidatus Pacearchaeota archaeon]
MAVIDDLVVELGQVGLWIQAVGLVVILWIIFQAITMYYNRKRRLILVEINERLKKIELKLKKIKP